MAAKKVSGTVTAMAEKLKSDARPKVAKQKIFTITGKRKTSIAKATIREGNGDVRINRMPLETFSLLRKLYLIEPFRIAEEVIGDQLRKVNISVTVTGGGSESQVEASRLSIAKALVAYTANQDLKAAFTKYDRSLLVADVRRKEMRKPGDSKARARRQTSYR